MIPKHGAIFGYLLFLFLSCTSEAIFFYNTHTHTTSLFSLSHHINHVIGGHLIRSLIMGIIYPLHLLVYVIIMENEQTTPLNNGNWRRKEAKRAGFLFWAGLSETYTTLYLLVKAGRKGIYLGHHSYFILAPFRG